MQSMNLPSSLISDPALRPSFQKKVPSLAKIGLQRVLSSSGRRNRP